MANYCVVAPPQILANLALMGQIGQHHLLLAHDIVKPAKQELYRELFHPDKSSTFFAQVILDNSCAELMKPVDLGMMKNAFDIVRPTCAVLPDVYLDAAKTAEESRKAYPFYVDMFYQERCELMYLPQGKTPSEFFKCATAEPMCTSTRIAWWGIPRNIVKLHGSRRKAIELCRALNPNRKIHLFGFSENLYDDIVCSQAPGVHSIDSAVPVRQKTKFPGPEFVGPRGTWWEEGQLEESNLANILAARQLFSGVGL